MRRVIYFGTLLILIMIFMTACGGSKDETEVTTEDNVTDETSESDKGQIRILTCDEPPINFMDGDKIVGTSVDIVEAMIKESGEDLEIEFLPWARAYEICLSDPNIMLFTAGQTQERDDLGLKFVGPMVTRKHALLALKSKMIVINSEENLKAYRIGGIIGDWRVKYFEDLGLTVDTNTSEESNYQKLVLGRLDMVISSDIEALILASLADIKPSDLEVVWSIKEAPSYIMFSKDTSDEEVEKWNKIFRKVTSSETMSELAEKWSNLLNAKILFDKEKGFTVE